MNIYYDKEKTKEIEQKIWSQYGDIEKKWAKHGYNVSECSGCELKCFNQRIGVERRITKGSIGFLVFGIVSEQVVMSIYPKEQQQYEANLHELVWGHMDVYEDFKYPIEGKATAKRIFKSSDLPLSWVKQLINYIVIGESLKGWMLILDIFTRNFSAFCIELTKEEKLLQIQLLMDKIKKFDEAILMRNSYILTISPEEYTNCFFKHNCERRSECRYKSKKLKSKRDASK